MPSTDRKRTLTRNMTSNPVEIEAVKAVTTGMPYGLAEYGTVPAADRFFVETVAQAQLDIIEHGIVNFVISAKTYATGNIDAKRWPLTNADRRARSRLAWEINAVEWEADYDGVAYASNFEQAVDRVLEVIYIELYATIAAHGVGDEPVLLWDHETNRLTYNYDAN